MYDVLDESISKLYEIKKQSFLNLLIETGKNIVSQDVLNKEVTPEQKEELLNPLVDSTMYRPGMGW